jgi:hypothetical protein
MLNGSKVFMAKYLPTFGLARPDAVVQCSTVEEFVANCPTGAYEVWHRQVWPLQRWSHLRLQRGPSANHEAVAGLGRRLPIALPINGLGQGSRAPHQNHARRPRFVG